MSMTEKEFPREKDLPADKHLREDIAAPEEESIADTEDHFTPGQTNAGQQVAGLASAPDYGEDQDLDSELDSNNPI